MEWSDPAVVAPLSVAGGTLLGRGFEWLKNRGRNSREQHQALLDDRAELTRIQRNRILDLERKVDRALEREDECQRNQQKQAVEIAELRGAVQLLQYQVTDKDKRIMGLEEDLVKLKNGKGE